MAKEQKRLPWHKKISEQLAEVSEPDVLDELLNQLESCEVPKKHAGEIMDAITENLDRLLDKGASLEELTDRFLDIMSYLWSRHRIWLVSLVEKDE